MARTIVIIPVFWGTAWRPGKGLISWTDVDADIRTVAASYYLAGLGGHGLASTATVQPAVLIDAADDEIPNNFNEHDCWSFLDGLIDSGTLPPPANWDQSQYRVYYGLAIAPGHSNADPATFGQNNKSYRGASAGYATANSDRAGVVTTYWHEVVEGAANDEIVDVCRARTFEINGVRVSRYQVGGPCWPYINDEISIGLADKPRSEGPFSAIVPILDGLCGTETFQYHVEYSTWRVTAVARAPGLDASTFLWNIGGKPVPLGQTSVLRVPVESTDPRPPKKPLNSINATVNVEQAAGTLSFTTDAADGNYAVEVQVGTLASAVASSQVLIEGIHCPELEAADKKCRDWLERQTHKLDRDYYHWIDPSDPLMATIKARPEVERERLRELVGGARQLRALGDPGAEELADRIAPILGVEPTAIFGTKAP